MSFIIQIMFSFKIPGGIPYITPWPSNGINNGGTQKQF
jgi:hypothetical protein